MILTFNFSKRVKMARFGRFEKIEGLELLRKSTFTK